MPGSVRRYLGLSNSDVVRMPSLRTVRYIEEYAQGWAVEEQSATDFGTSAMKHKAVLVDCLVNVKYS